MIENLREFEDGMEEEIDLVTREVGQRRNDIVMLAVETLTTVTPVDTGRANGNYVVTTREPAVGYDWEMKDKAGGATQAKARAVLEAEKDPFVPAFIHNGVPYIRYLNDGTVRNRAHRMVEQAIARVRGRFG